MQKNELAKLLDLSPSMVTKLTKRGMPTDSLERAEKWRRRNLEPGRVKGSRFDPNKPPTPAKPVTTPRALPGVSVAEVEAVATLTNSALEQDNQDTSENHIVQTRALLRQLPDDAKPRLSLRVWLALVDYVIRDDADIRHALDLAALLTPEEFGRRVSVVCVWPAVLCLDHARDWRDISMYGWPAYPNDGHSDVKAIED